MVAAVLELAIATPRPRMRCSTGVRELTDRAVGEGGLEEALLDEGEGEEEAALEREDRRARRGFVAPHAARSFLAFAVEVDLETQIAFGRRDPDTAAYFRDWDHAGGAGRDRDRARRRRRGATRGARVPGAGRDGGLRDRGGRFTVGEAADAVLAVCRIGEAVVGSGRAVGPVDAASATATTCCTSGWCARRASWAIGPASPTRSPDWTDGSSGPSQT